jgi:hypothetical protein
LGYQTEILRCAQNDNSDVAGYFAGRSHYGM